MNKMYLIAVVCILQWSTPYFSSMHRNHNSNSLISVEVYSNMQYER